MLQQSMRHSKMVKYYIFISCIVYGTIAMSIKEGNILKELRRFDEEYSRMWWERQKADWQYSTNVTSDNMEIREYTAERFSNFMKYWKLWARGVNSTELAPFIKEALDIIASGIVVMNAEDAREISHLRSKMVKIYSSANISIPKLKIKAQGESEYGSLMGKIRDPDILKQIWSSWRTEVGEKIRPDFLKLVNLMNKAAQENGYENVGSSWRNELGSDDVMDVALFLWDEVKPFYAHLHAYVRHKLQQTYGEEHFSNNNLIPAHLLGSLWSENWVSLNNILAPYPTYPILNLTESFNSENFSVHDVIEKAEEFYVKAGLPSMRQSFWEKSMFTKPKDGRLVDCHAASYDFALNCDYRIRMCGEVKEQSFLEAVHELGHIEYYMLYNYLPMIYRNGANSAFHEAVGETMVYAVQSPQCLRLLNIVNSSEMSREMLLNFLMKQALSKLTLLPWALTVESFRYSLFEGDITEENMNQKWWCLRKCYQGIEPPDEENSKLFDAGTKYHVINNIPYIRYFIGRFLEHQFLEALCEKVKEDIHSCCFIKDKTAGMRLKKMLELGSYASWEDALETLTGQRSLSAEPLIQYYKPLFLWLKDYNERHNIEVFI